MQDKLSTARIEVALLRLSSLGDLCMCLPLVHRLLQDAKVASLYWFIDQNWANLFEGLCQRYPHLTLVVVDKKKLSSIHFAQKQLGLKGFDLLLHVHPSLRANLASLFIKAKKKTGLNPTIDREFQNLFVNNQPKKSLGENAHMVDYFLQVADVSGIKALQGLGDPFELPFFPSQSLQSKVLPSLDEKRPNVVLNLEASKDHLAKSPPFHFWKSLIQRFEQQLNFICIGMKNPQLSKEVDQLNKQTTIKNLVGKTSLLEMATFIYKADLVISPDSGPSHLAKAFNKPVLAIYSATNPAFTGIKDNPLNVNFYRSSHLEKKNKRLKDFDWDDKKVLQTCEKRLDLWFSEFQKASQAL